MDQFHQTCDQSNLYIKPFDDQSPPDCAFESVRNQNWQSYVILPFRLLYLFYETNHHIDLKNLDTHETEYNDFVLTTV